MIRQTSVSKSKSLQTLIVIALVIILFGGGYALSTVLARLTVGTPNGASAAGASAASAANGAAWVNPPHPVQDFTLTAQTGDPMSLSSLRGEPVVLLFGYTHCPDVCPTTLAQFKQAKALLGDAGEHVHFVFISVDGERDTPALLADYVTRFDPDFIGMSGTDDVLHSIANDYGLLYEIDQHAPGAQDYGVAHSSAAYLIDQKGALRAMFFFGTGAPVIADSIKQILAEGA